MKLYFEQSRLLDLMKSFHLLTGIRIVLFDDEYHQLLSWPEKDCAFCRCMKQDPEASKFCKQSDEFSFKESKEKKKLIIYHCHTGLIEATVPLIDNHVVIGYLMFGQISDTTSIADLDNMLQEALTRYDISDDTIDMPEQTSYFYNEIPLKDDAQIQAAAKILEACTFYAIYDEMVMLRRQNFSDQLEDYVALHISEPLDSSSIAQGLGLSRSVLYLSCDKYLGMGIAEYVRNQRIEKAKHLLRTTSDKISVIAEDVGFADYNYFCRVFKKEAGSTPNQYRNSHV